MQTWQVHYRNVRRRRQIQAQIKNDLPIGSVAPQLKDAPVNAEWNLSAVEKPTIIVFIGPCSSCMAQNLVAWQKVYDKWSGKLRILIISRDSRDHIVEFVKMMKLTLPVIPDPDGSLAKAYNAAWVRRVYGINSKGILVWIESDMTSKVDPVRCTQEVWAAVRGERP
jgi:peroxiredoxin